MVAAEQLAPIGGVVLACRALGVSRASFYRRRRPASVVNRFRPKPRRSLSQTERQIVLDVLSSERFMDKVPAEVYTTLLNEGIYLCSIRTMYRILAQEDEIRNRRNQLRHLSYQKPELLVTQPNQLWSWDITKLVGPNKWTNFYLYVILDHFSRYVVGWKVARRESGSLAGQLIQETYREQKIARNQLTLHSDRGSSTTCKSVKLLLSNLGVPQKTHSQPPALNHHYSESQLKILEDQPLFPAHFGCVEDAQAFCQEFFAWYNTEYHQFENSLLTPEVVHYGLDQQIVKQQQQLALSAAYLTHPERFVHHPPQPPGRTMASV